MGAVYTVDFHFTVKPMNVCPPQKKYNSEGMYGAPLEKKMCLQVLGHSVRLISVGSTD